MLASSPFVFHSLRQAADPVGTEIVVVEQLITKHIIGGLSFWLLCSCAACACLFCCFLVLAAERLFSPRVPVVVAFSPP